MMDVYRIEVKRLPQAEGGGFLAWAPELPGCMSDGDTPKEAESRCRQAIGEWLDQAHREGLQVPRPDDSRALA